MGDQKRKIMPVRSICVIAARILSKKINIYELNDVDYQFMSQQMADVLGIRINNEASD